MTYITPDFLALRSEAEHYAKRHPLNQGPRFAGGRGFRGEHLPLLSAAPIPPLTVKDYNPKVLGPIPGPNAITISPLDEAVQDDPRGPGAFLDQTQRSALSGIFPGSLPRSLRGLGEVNSDPLAGISATWIGAGTLTVCGIALLLWLRRR